MQVFKVQPINLDGFPSGDGIFFDASAPDIDQRWLEISFPNHSVTGPVTLNIYDSVEAYEEDANAVKRLNALAKLTKEEKKLLGLE